MHKHVHRSSHIMQMSSDLIIPKEFKLNNKIRIRRPYWDDIGKIWAAESLNPCVTTKDINPAH